MIPRELIKFPLPPDIDLTEDGVFHEEFLRIIHETNLLPWELLEDNWISIGLSSGTTNQSARRIMFNNTFDEPITLKFIEDNNIDVWETTSTNTLYNNNNTISLETSNNSVSFTYGNSVYTYYSIDDVKVNRYRRSNSYKIDEELFLKQYDHLPFSPPFYKDYVLFENILELSVWYNDWRNDCLDPDSLRYIYENEVTLIDLRSTTFHSRLYSMCLEDGTIDIDKLKVEDDDEETEYDKVLPWENDRLRTITLNRVEDIMWTV